MIDVFFRGYGRWMTDEGVNSDNSPALCNLTDDSLFQGVFRLGKETSEIYRYTKRFDHVTCLFPNYSRPDSGFVRTFGKEMAQSSAEFLQSSGNSYYEIFFIDAKKKFELFLAEPFIEKGYKTELSEKERKTMLKLIIGMAIDGYGYDPRSPRNTATGENNTSIQSRLQCQGILIDNDTIRNYLVAPEKA